MQRHRAVLTFWGITSSRGGELRARRVCESSRTRSAKTHGEAMATASEGSLRPSIQSFAAGSCTSNTALPASLGCWMVGYEDAFGAFFDVGYDSVAAVAAAIISDGLTPTSSGWVSTPWPRLITCSSGLVETTDWRAGCGKSARPVRREGEANHLSLPPMDCHARLRARPLATATLQTSRARSPAPRSSE